MTIKQANGFVEKLGMCDTTTCAYKIINYEKDSVETEIIQYFIMHGLVLCIKVNIYVAHMLYVC